MSEAVYVGVGGMKVGCCEFLYIFSRKCYNWEKENNMTTTYADIHVKVNKEVKEESEKILNLIGISMSDLINMTLRRVVYERRIPFDTRIERDEVPEDLKISTREELNMLLDRLSADDEDKMLSNDEMWRGVRKHMKEVEMRRATRVKI